jgi:DNA-binding NarL/FixJ family response regulator
MTKTRIVVAAAHGGMRAQLDAALAGAGFQVTADCDTAQAAVEAVGRDHPDVCVVDAALPGGALVAAAAIAAPPSPPAVIVIDRDGTWAAGRAAEIAGAAACLRGDLDVERLAEVVRKVAKRRRTTRVLNKEER